MVEVCLQHERKSTGIQTLPLLPVLALSHSLPGPLPFHSPLCDYSVPPRLSLQFHGASSSLCVENLWYFFQINFFCVQVFQSTFQGALSPSIYRFQLHCRWECITPGSSMSSCLGKVQWSGKSPLGARGRCPHQTNISRSSYFAHSSIHLVGLGRSLTKMNLFSRRIWSPIGAHSSQESGW